MICSGYADRIHELMGISRELAARDASSQQPDGHRNYVSEANYIEFDGVKVAKKFGISFPYSSHPCQPQSTYDVSGCYSNWQCIGGGFDSKG